MIECYVLKNNFFTNCLLAIVALYVCIKMINSWIEFALSIRCLSVGKAKNRDEEHSFKKKLY